MNDFRPYKVGSSIPENMQMPEDAKQDVYEYRWLFNVDGEEKVITTQGNVYPQIKGEFVSVETELVEEGYEPPIHDFSLVKEDKDFIDRFMAEQKLLMLPSYDLALTKSEAWEDLKPVLSEAKAKGYTVIIVTSSGTSDQNRVNELLQQKMDYYIADETAIKTIVRSNPGLMSLSKGVILQKLHWHDVIDLEL